MKETAELKISLRLIGQDKRVAILALNGYIDSTTAPTLKHELTTIGNDTHRFILDFSKVEYVSSAGWGVVLAKIRENREKGGDIVFVNMIKEVHSIYELLELNRVIKYFPSLENALKYFGVTAPVQATAADTVTPSVKTKEKPAEPATRALSLQEAILSVVKNNPLLNSSQLKKILQTPEYGFKRLGTIKIYFILRRMGLNTREKRLYYAWMEEKKINKG
jgi:anti-sigma B factor antagonist